VKHDVVHHDHTHARNAVMLALLAIVVLAALDVRVPWEIRAPVSLVLLLAALFFALHDPIHSVWRTHRHARVPVRSHPPRRDIDRRLRSSRPGWM